MGCAGATAAMRDRVGTLTAVRSLRRPGVLIGSCILLFAGCSSSSDPDVADVGRRAPATIGAESADAATATDRPVSVASPLARWGTGRAMLARYDPVGRRTAVVTTVEVSLHGDDGAVDPDRGRPRRAVRTHGADRRRTAARDRRRVVGHGDRLGSRHRQAVDARVHRRRSGRPPRVLARRLGGRRQHRDGGHPCAARRIRAVRAGRLAAQGPLGPAAIAPDGSWIVVPVASADGARIALWRPEGVSIIDLPVADGVNARDAVASPSGTHVGVVDRRARRPVRGASRDLGRRAGLAHRHDPARRRRPGSPWAFGPDDRVLVADGAATTPVEPVRRAAADARRCRRTSRCSRCSASATGAAS